MINQLAGWLPRFALDLSPPSHRAGSHVLEVDRHPVEMTG